MHEPTIYWALEPPHALLLYAFLVMVCVITLVRVVRLVLALFAAPWRKRLSIEDVLTQRVEPDRLSTLALAHAISCKGPFNVPDAFARPDVRRLLRMANVRFNYRWRMSYARVAATKGLLRLTLLVSFATVCYGAYPSFWDAYSNTNATLLTGWFAAGKLLLARLVIGLSVCIVLTGVHMFFQGRLIRRKASWRLFHATALDALSRPRE
jgi:hypothetical protein